MASVVALHRICAHLAVVVGLIGVAAAQDESLRSEQRARSSRPEFMIATDETAGPLIGRSRYFADATDDDSAFDERWDAGATSATGVTSDEPDHADAHQFASESQCVEDDLPFEIPAREVPVCPPLVRSRNGSYQGTSASVSLIHDDPDTGISIRSLTASAVFAVPIDGMNNMLMFTPYIQADLLDSAAALDVPDFLMDAGFKTAWRKTIDDRWSSLLVFTPSVRGDTTTQTDAFKLFGLGLLTYQWVPKQLAVSGGVVYTGRDDFPVLPAVGLLWTPNPDVKLDLQFPAPRLSRCIRRDAGLSETWIYLAGVFGGNTFAVSRASLADDQLTLRDLRLMAGIELLKTKNQGVFAEVGYVFNRSMEYVNVPFERDLDATWAVRAGWSF